MNHFYFTILILNFVFPQSWHKQKAIYLFDQAIKFGMDGKYGGIVYGYSSEGKFTNSNKYFWVQAEALAASWRLYKKTKSTKYHDFYILCDVLVLYFYHLPEL